MTPASRAMVLRFDGPFGPKGCGIALAGAFYIPPRGALLSHRLRGGKRTRFVGKQQRPENRVNPFPWRKVVPTGTKGGFRNIGLVVKSRYRGFPLARFAGLPPHAVAEQPVLTIEQLMKEMPCGALLCPHLREKGGAVRHQRGSPPQAAFIPAPQAPTTTLTAEGRVKPLNPLHLLNPHARQGVNPRTRRVHPLPPLTRSPSPIDGGGKF